MLAYAANRPRIGARQSNPNALLVVICGHIVLVAFVMSAKMSAPPRTLDPPTSVISIPLPNIPPPQPASGNRSTQQAIAHNSDPQPEVVPTATDAQVPLSLGGASESVPLGGGGTTVIPSLPLPPPFVPVSSSAAQLLTPPSELRPPYPQSKLLAEEEATLTLRLTIDDQGHVVGVDPVGRADATFLAAARRHLLAHWRYKPAMKDGRKVGSTIVITLRFQLDG